MVRAKEELARKRIGDTIITIVLSIILAVLSWEAFTAILPFVLEYPTYGSVIFIALGVLSWAFWRHILFSFKFVRRYFHEARVNIMLSVSWERRDPDEILEVLDPIKIKEHRKVPSLEQRQASAGSATGVPPATPASPTTPPCKKKKNGTMRKRK